MLYDLSRDEVDLIVQGLKMLHGYYLADVSTSTDVLYDVESAPAKGDIEARRLKNRAHEALNGADDFCASIERLVERKFGGLMPR